jgi:hypothetical protein
MSLAQTRSLCALDVIVTRGVIARLGDAELADVGHVQVEGRAGRGLALGVGRGKLRRGGGLGAEFLRGHGEHPDDRRCAHGLKFWAAGNPVSKGG